MIPGDSPASPSRYMHYLAEHTAARDALDNLILDIVCGALGLRRNHRMRCWHTLAIASEPHVKTQVLGQLVFSLFPRGVSLQRRNATPTWPRNPNVYIDDFCSRPRRARDRPPPPPFPALYLGLGPHAPLDWIRKSFQF